MLLTTTTTTVTIFSHYTIYKLCRKKSSILWFVYIFSSEECSQNDSEKL